MSESLAVALPKEMARVGELIGLYKEIGPAGEVGILLMRLSLRAAEKALAEGDVVAQIACLEDLRGYKE